MNAPSITASLLAASLCVLLATGCPRPPLRMVYDQGNCTSLGWLSELNPVDDNTWGQQTGDDFVLTEGNATVTQVRWWGAYQDDLPVEDDFTFRLYDDIGALVPGTEFSSEYHAGAVTRAMTEDFLRYEGNLLNVYAYTCNVPAAHFEPGRRYFLVILNDTGKWMWALCEYSDAGNEICTRRNTTTAPWSVYGTDVAFQFWSNSR